MSLSGTDLSHDYFTEVVRPLVDERWPGLPLAAGRFGSGSDVLGLDDALSRDHDWGLRLTILVEQDVVEPIRVWLAQQLPPEYRGHPTRFATTWHPVPTVQVEVSTADEFVSSRTGVGPEPLGITDWLSLTGQSVLEVTAGGVFADDAGAFAAIRNRFDWYPDDVWRYVLAAEWARIGQEFPFVGRAASRGDEVGSGLIAGRIAVAAMRLGFLLERRWPPYSKWLGTMFADLPIAADVAPALTAALGANRWENREAGLATAVTALNERQRHVGLPSVAAAVEPFWDRPFLGIGAVPETLLESITDERVRELPAGIGSIEQVSDSVSVLVSPERRRTVMAALLAGGGSTGR